MVGHPCRNMDYCTLDQKYTHWKKCPEDHEVWRDAKMTEINHDIYECYTRATAAGADITAEMDSFDQGRLAWMMLETEENARIEDDAWTMMENLYYVTDMYSNFNTHLNTEYNIFHEAVERKILAASRTPIIGRT